MLPTLNVVAVILIAEQKVLIAQRSEAKFQQKWEFPGGKIEQGESPESALSRELQEELNIQCSEFEHFADSQLQLEEKVLHLQTYICHRFSGHMQVRVHADVRWVPFSELTNYSFLEADIPIVEKLQEVFG